MAGLLPGAFGAGGASKSALSEIGGPFAVAGLGVDVVSKLFDDSEKEARKARKKAEQRAALDALVNQINVLAQFLQSDTESRRQLLGGL